MNLTLFSTGLVAVPMVYTAPVITPRADDEPIEAGESETDNEIT